jgi:hypothetical protein
MIYIPKIADYKPFYIQTESDAAAVDTTEWGLIAKSNPYPLLPNPKAPHKNEWLDENGDEEYVKEMYYESIEFSVSFYVKAYNSEGLSAEEAIRNQVEGFFSKIRSGEFKVFDSYTGIGRQKVRYAGYKEESFTKRKDWARAIFTISLKVNDPVTRITLVNDKLEAE